MTGKKILFDALEHNSPDRTPWVPYTGVHVGSLRGYSADTLYSDGDKLFECLREAHRAYTPDGMPVMFDLQIEAEALGCDLKWDQKAPPTVSSHILEEDKALSAPLPQASQGRIPMVLDVMRRMKQEVGETTALYGLVTGPFTMASHLRGMNIFIDMYDDESYVKQLLGQCLEIARTMAGYYIDAGMDVIAAVDPLVSQISPEFFATYLNEVYTSFFTSLREQNVYSSMFVCGDATDNVEEMCKTRPDCLSIDENIDIVKAKEITDRYNVVMSGNLQLTSVMLLGTQKDNQKAALDLIDALGTKNFILAPGCDLPYDVPKENLVGITQVVQDVQAARSFLSGYATEAVDIDVPLPDYANLSKPLLEVFTLDSATCAACGYMLGAAQEAAQHFGDRIDMVEYKMTTRENIARAGKMELSSIPSICVNGRLKFASIIPPRRDLFAEIEKVL